MFKPRLTFGTVPTAWTLQLPPQEWEEERATVGGSGRAAGGALAGYTVREDFLLHVPLRMYHDEWPTLQALLAWAETGATFTFEPDPVGRPDVSIEVTLESPRAGESTRPRSDPAYSQIKLVTLVLKRADGLAFNLDFFAPADWPAES